MKTLRRFLISSLFFTIPAWATDSIDSASVDALLNTLQTLTIPTQREKAVQENSNAQLADKQVKSLAGSQANTQQVYELAAEIFQTLVEKSKGDPLAALAQLQNAKDDPKAFMESLTPAQKAKLKSISQKIQFPQKQGSSGNPSLR